MVRRSSRDIRASRPESRRIGFNPADLRVAFHPATGVRLTGKVLRFVCSKVAAATLINELAEQRLGLRKHVRRQVLL